MSFIDTIVSALRSLTSGGTEDSTAASGSAGPEPEGQVSVEHEPDASTEAAVKGGGAASEVTDDDAESGGTGDDIESGGTSDDAAAAGTDAAASTGALVDEDTGKEPAEAVGGAGGVDVDRTTDEGDVDSQTEAESDEADSEATSADETADAEAEPADEAEAEPADEADGAEAAAEDSTESVETIKGIGPAYAGRLEEFGIETVGGLAAADAADVAEGIDVSESRVSDWIERAGETS